MDRPSAERWRAVARFARGSQVFHVALFLNVLFVLTIAWASYGHFSRDEREPMGAKALALATAAGTLANVGLAYVDPRPGPLASAAAIVLSAVAFAVFFAAVHATRKGGLSLAFSERTPSAVIDSGIYGIVRHPFYTSYCLYWLSWVPLTNAAPLSVLIGGAMGAAYIVAARKEERLLTARLGQAYAALMRRTWRLVPGLH